MDAVTFFAVGTPKPKGSMRAFLPHGGTRPIVTHDNTGTRPWQSAVALGAVEARDRQGWFTGAVTVQVEFLFPRPASRKKARYMTVRPDTDKCLRLVLDALTRVLYPDDAAVVAVCAGKRYAGPDEVPGAHITVRDAAKAAEETA